MSSKRVKTSSGWYVPTPGTTARASSSRTIEALVGVMDTWYYQEAQALQELYNKKLVENQTLQMELVRTMEANSGFVRRLNRYQTLLGLANAQVANQRRELTFKTGLIAEIFTRFPEVAHEYEWAYNSEVLGSDGETTEEELL